MTTPKKSSYYALALAYVQLALDHGDLPRLLEQSVPCVDCGKRAHRWEHRDYKKPLEVVPVCTRCNWERGPGANKMPGLNEKPEDFQRRTAKPRRGGMSLFSRAREQAFLDRAEYIEAQIVLGRTQTAIASELGISPGRVSQILTGLEVKRHATANRGERNDR